MVKSRVASIVSVIFFGVCASVYVARPVSTQVLMVFGDTIPVAGAAFAVVATWLAASSFGAGEAHKKAWGLLSLGLALWLLGESSWWIQEVALGDEVPYPSSADIFWLAGYLPLFAGFVLNYRRLDIKIGWRSMVLWLVPLCLVTAVSSVFVFQPVLDSKIPILEKVLNLAYPLEDIVLLAAALLTLTGLGYGVLNRPWKFLVTGFVLMLGADLAYSYLSFFGLYRTGSLTDLVWLAGYLVIGVGALLQTELVS